MCREPATAGSRRVRGRDGKQAYLGVLKTLACRFEADRPHSMPMSSPSPSCVAPGPRPAARPAECGG